MLLATSRCIFVVALCVAGAAAVAEETLGELEKIDAVRAPGNNFSFKAEVIDPKGRKLKLSVRVKDRYKSLVRYLAPPRSAGRSLLFVGRDMWVYIPGTRRVLRISPQQQLLGGFSSADIARTVYSLDYEVDSVEQLPDIDGESARQLNLVGKKGSGAAYARIRLTVAGDESRPLAAVFFATAGDRQLRSAFFEDYRELLGRKRPMVMRIVDHTDGDSETVMRYSELSLEDTPDAWFQPSYLKRLR